MGDFAVPDLGGAAGVDRGDGGVDAAFERGGVDVDFSLIAARLGGAQEEAVEHGIMVRAAGFQAADLLDVEIIGGEDMVERPGEERVARAEGIVEAAPAFGVAEMGVVLELAHHPGPADLVEISHHEGGAFLLAQLVGDDHQLVIEIFGRVARAGRARVDAVEAHFAAAGLDVDCERGHVALAEIALLHAGDGMARIDEEAVMFLLGQKACVGVGLLERTQGGAPAGIGFREEDNVGIGLADAGADGVFIGVFLQHIEEEYGEARALGAGQGGGHLQRAAAHIGPEVCRAGDEGGGIGEHQQHGGQAVYAVEEEEQRGDDEERDAGLLAAIDPDAEPPDLGFELGDEGGEEAKRAQQVEGGLEEGEHGRAFGAGERRACCQSTRGSPQGCAGMGGGACGGEDAGCATGMRAGAECTPEDVWPETEKDVSGEAHVFSGASNRTTETMC